MNVSTLPEHDARTEAWLTARSLLESARKLTTDHKGRVREPLPELYWGVLREAELWAALAQADKAVGVDAGDYLTLQRQTEVERRKMMKQEFCNIAQRESEGD
ncbi:hypothetical protein PBI_GAIA_174 [Mycobacterium phage Gaia]|uniref:Uncharacterized protein n=1 Tax=Mycobacterium phage Gaia TaxID=1486472 RepID=A0A068F8Z9_9CAUD|nr:hypothetical protein VC46_gp062 [Mycobacterium phage Gaia]AID58990.1 hypothetical protein PBI_GAIA_174 [Mycobacterium phage Gaia]